VKLTFGIDAASHFALAQGFNDGGDAGGEIVGFLGRFEAGVGFLAGVVAEAFEDGMAGAGGGLVAHEDADLAELLPRPVEREQGAGFEEPGGNV
jgi:hypothetical protein